MSTARSAHALFPSMKVLCICELDWILEIYPLSSKILKDKKNEIFQVKTEEISNIKEVYNQIYIKSCDWKLITNFKSKLQELCEIIILFEEDVLNSPDIKQFETELLMDGLIDIKKLKNANRIVAISAVVPNVKIGAAKIISLESKKKSIWRLDMEEDQDDDMIDLDELLNEDDFLVTKNLNKSKSCGIDLSNPKKQKRACKDCTCGLKDLQDNGNSNNTQQPKSSCQNCYLGDAFRCSSCPYKGLPPFRPGEQVQLNKNILQDDLI